MGLVLNGEGRKRMISMVLKIGPDWSARPVTVPVQSGHLD